MVVSTAPLAQQQTDDAPRCRAKRKHYAYLLAAGAGLQPKGTHHAQTKVDQEEHGHQQVAVINGAYLTGLLLPDEPGIGREVAGVKVAGTHVGQHPGLEVVHKALHTDAPP